MVETATKTTTPRRPRSAATKAPTAKAATTKAAPAKAAAKPAPTPTEDEKVVYTFAPRAKGETKNYATFDLSTDEDGNATGCVGTVYAPLGTETVKVRIEGPADAIEAE